MKGESMSVNLRHTSLLLLLFAVPAVFAGKDEHPKPQRIILNLTETPATSMAVTWRMPCTSANPVVEYAVATPGPEFAKKVKKMPAAGEMLNVPLQPEALHCSAVLRDLVPATRYVYRVGSDSCWSEWNQFSTADTSRLPFSFIWFGDPQDDILEHISRLFRQTVWTTPAARFWLFSGDLTTEPEDHLLGEFFEAAGFSLRSIPSAMVPGNHDQPYKYENGTIARDKRDKKIRLKEVSRLWQLHFTLPENGVTGLEETNYSFDYQGVRFIMVNSNTRLAEQAVWMENLLKENPNRWTVAIFHHPLYSSGRDRDDKDTRKAFLALFDRYHVDLVLTGHDHTYARSQSLINGSVAAPDTQGTVYVVSACGPKFYKYTSLYDSLMAKSGVNVQLFQHISVAPDSLSYQAFTADGVLFDQFILKK
jgi:hypothetical protein